ncbi:MAG: hypothetical protein EPO65_11755 [Dehalococcoidia bacterium]|nr:MAG: hypothetical protein EPO65_11755 [Dehalococcoidia bacterium]
MTILLLAYDRLIWRWPLIRGLTPRPVLYGTWKAELRTSFAPRANEIVECYLTIRQTYSSIQVDMVFEHSRSFSLSAALAEQDGRVQLSYTYRSQGDALHQDGNPPSRGAAVLIIAREPSLHLEGDYWMERGTKGTIRTLGHNPTLLESFTAARGARFS